MYVFFDIETFSGEEKTPTAKKNDKTFKPYEGFVVAISCLIITRTKKFHFVDGFTKSMMQGGTLAEYCAIEEKKLFEKFEKFISSDKELIEMLPGMVWIGHNIKGFDLLFMRPRALKYKCTNLSKALPVSVRDSKKIFDTMSEAAMEAYGQFVSYKTLTSFYGLTAKNVMWKGQPMDGSRVHDLFMAGDTETMKKYVDDDILDMPALYKKMTGRE